MKILFVHTVAQMSIADVARGYRAALERSGHEVCDYYLNTRFQYHARAMPPTIDNPTLVSKMASETILNEAMYFHADLVLIISGLNVHPIALWLLGKVNIPAAVILTESPYDDDSQKQWTDLTHVDSTVDLTVFTNDRYSAIKYGWHFLAPSYDPAIHHPVEPDPEGDCDVLIIGTGWPERQKFLEAINWTGIKLKMYGIWPTVTEDSVLHQYLTPLIVNNNHVPGMYCAAKINLNIHRGSDTAMTPGPRVFEVAACGAFQMSDRRSDMVDIFGGSIPTFRTPQELEADIKYYLDHPGLRKVKAAEALDRVCSHDFDARVSVLEDVIHHRLGVQV